MSQGTILVAGFIRFAQKELTDLSKRYQVDHVPAITRPEFFELCKTQYQGVKTVVRESSSVPNIGHFDEELINALPERYAMLITVSQFTVVLTPC